jgi:hypothetical protein
LLDIGVQPQQPSGSRADCRAGQSSGGIVTDCLADDRTDSRSADRSPLCVIIILSTGTPAENKEHSCYSYKEHFPGHHCPLLPFFYFHLYYNTPETKKDILSKKKGRKKYADSSDPP